MGKLTIASAIITLLAMVLSGCSTSLTSADNDESTGAGSTGETATIEVTRNFGRELILERDIPVEPGTTALEALQSVATVETQYGGGFVSSINGVGSENSGTGREKKDWFFHINGIAGNTGAGDYILRPGDSEHWDYREWGYHQFVPAVIGDFPQPFLSGYRGERRPTALVYEDAFAGEAEDVVTALKKSGVAEVTAYRIDEFGDEDRENSNIIIIGLPSNALIAEMNGLHRKLGFYAFFARDELTVLDAAGEAAGIFGAGYGLIQATQNPWNPKGTGAGENAAWMVTGTDADGVRSAARVLSGHADKLCKAFAVIVYDDAVTKIP